MNNPAMMRCPDDYNEILIRLPGDIHSAVRINADGYPTIYINVDLSPEARKAALRHELYHFQNGDMYSHLTIQDVETGATRAEKMDIILRGNPNHWIDAAITYHILKASGKLDEWANEKAV